MTTVFSEFVNFTILETETLEEGKDQDQPLLDGVDEFTNLAKKATDLSGLLSGEPPEVCFFILLKIICVCPSSVSLFSLEGTNGNRVS